MATGSLKHLVDEVMQVLVLLIEVNAVLTTALPFCSTAGGRGS